MADAQRFPRGGVGPGHYPRGQLSPEETHGWEAGVGA